jgi:hypothetical protein
MAEETLLQTVWLGFGKDKILRIRILEGTRIDLKLAKIITENMRRHAADGRIPILIDARASYTWDKEAQQYMAENSEFRLATAVISNNPLTRLISNTYVRIFKPNYPVKMFTEENEAVEWLLGIDK